MVLEFLCTGSVPFPSVLPLHTPPAGAVARGLAYSCASGSDSQVNCTRGPSLKPWNTQQVWCGLNSSACCPPACLHLCPQVSPLRITWRFLQPEQSQHLLSSSQIFAFCLWPSELLCLGKSTKLWCVSKLKARGKKNQTKTKQVRFNLFFCC